MEKTIRVVYESELAYGALKEFANNKGIGLFEEENPPRIFSSEVEEKKRKMRELAGSMRGKLSTVDEFLARKHDEKALER